MFSVRMVGGVSLTAALVFAGCGTIDEAQYMQEALASKGCTEVAPSVEKLSLTDASLKELVGFAMTNRPSIIAAALAVKDARLALQEIAADAPLVSGSPWTSPHLSLSGGYSASSESPRQSLSLRTEGNASASLSLQILLFDFGRNQARANAQIENVIASEYAFIKEGYQIFEDVSTAYFDLMERSALLEVALTNELEYAAHLRQAEDRLAAGEAQRLDVTRARSNLSLAKEETIAASNYVQTAGAALMKALGIDVSRGTCEEVYPLAGSTLSTLMRGFPATKYDVSAAFDLARTNAPTMAIARAKFRAADADVDRAIADLMPSVSAEVGINWADPLWAWHWGVSAVQSLFQGFKKVTAVDRAVVALQTAALNVDEAEQQLSLDLETAIAVRDNSVKKLETARATARFAHENLALVKARYLEGEASRVDFTDALSEYATALGNRVSAFYINQLAEARLFALTGRMPEYREEEIHEK